MPEAIFEDGPVDTPYIYTVTGHGAVTPRACQAVYDGTGAGGDFLPAVIFRSQAGNVIARAILDTTIVAGASAEVSWFPGVKHAAAAAAATGTPFATVQLKPVANPLLTGAYAPDILTLETNTPGASVFSVNAGTPSFLQVAEAGIYCVYGQFNTGTPITLPVGGFVTVQVVTAGLIGTIPTNVVEIANTVATRRIQEMSGIAFTQFAGADTLRYIIRVNQSTAGIGDLGYSVWRIDPSLAV